MTYDGETKQTKHPSNGQSAEKEGIYLRIDSDSHMMKIETRAEPNP